MTCAFNQFAETWLDPLRGGARVAFEHGPLPLAQASPQATADAFVELLKLKPIGFNWELLDPVAEPGAARSAKGEVIAALSARISDPGKSWLSRKEAEQCADDFLALFDPAQLTLVSNRYDGLWNPIAGAQCEWGFVAFDPTNAALLLITD